jgi:hypothetical protein
MDVKWNSGEETAEVHILNRRELVVLLGTTAAASLVGCAGGRSSSYAPTTIASCLVSPTQTEGPYFVDEQLNRSDIRIDPADGSERPGVHLRLVLHV